MYAHILDQTASLGRRFAWQRGSRYWIITLTSSPWLASIDRPRRNYSAVVSHTPGLSLCTRPPFGAPDGAAIFVPEPTLVLVTPVI